MLTATSTTADESSHLQINDNSKKANIFTLLILLSNYYVDMAPSYQQDYSLQLLTSGWSHGEHPAPDCEKSFQSSGCLHLVSVNKNTDMHTLIKM